jgi:hypothetical protein
MEISLPPPAKVRTRDLSEKLSVSTPYEEVEIELMEKM